MKKASTGFPAIFADIRWKRIVEHRLGIFLEEPVNPIQEKVEQYAVYDENTLYVGDIQSKGTHFCGSELSEAILALGVWETAATEMEVARLQKKLEIQYENLKNFVALFEQARKTVYDMRTSLLKALPLVGWWHKKLLVARIQSAISLADKEIPRQQRHCVLTQDDKVIPQ